MDLPGFEDRVSAARLERDQIAQPQQFAGMPGKTRGFTPRQQAAASYWIPAIKQSLEAARPGGTS